MSSTRVPTLDVAQADRLARGASVVVERRRRPRHAALVHGRPSRRGASRGRRAWSRKSIPRTSGAGPSESPTTATICVGDANGRHPVLPARGGPRARCTQLALTLRDGRRVVRLWRAHLSRELPRSLMLEPDIRRSQLVRRRDPARIRRSRTHRGARVDAPRDGRQSRC